MRILRLTGAASAAALALAMAASAQQQDLSAVEITSVDLGDNHFMLIGAGGAAGVSIGPDGVFMVDTQFAPLTEKLAAKIAELGGGTPRFIVNTHYHGDHNGGNENFAAMGATVVAHENLRTRLSQPSVSPSGQTNPARPAEALPVITYDDGVVFHMNGEAVHAIHIPNAHTDGDTIVWFEGADVIYMGDTMNWNSYPRIDLNAQGSLDGLIRVSETALSLADDDTQIVPGHGATTPLTKADLQSYLDMMVAARDVLAPLAASSQTVEEIVAADPLAAMNERWGNAAVNPSAFVTSVVTDMRTPPAEPSE